MHIFLHEPVGKQNLHAVLGKQGTAQYAHRFKDFAFQLGARFVVSICLVPLSKHAANIVIFLGRRAKKYEKMKETAPFDAVSDDIRDEIRADLTFFVLQWVALAY